MTNEEKKARRHAYYKKWYDARKNSIEFREKRNAIAREKYETNHEKYIAYFRAYRRRIDFKAKTREYAKKYYAEHREEIIAKQRERYANMTPEQRAQHSKSVHRARQRRNAVRRAEMAQKQLEAKAQSVAEELNKLFDGWDR